MNSGGILIVEDNLATRKLYRVSLQAEGYDVLEAEDGRSATELVAARSPALALLDCRLPDVGGVELARRLRDRAPELSLVAITGWAQLDDAEMSNAGFSDVLLKPVEPQRLVEVVNRYVRPPELRARRVGKCVLLVDDDPVQLKLARLSFCDAGFEVLTAGTGECGLQLALERAPDVIVSDVLMPGMDGFTLCRTLRADSRLCAIPVVLTSAHYLEQQDRDLAAQFGASRYVSRNAGFETVVHAAVDALGAPLPSALPVPGEQLEVDYMHRVARQLERQAALGSGLARRVSMQATALSVLEGISDALARQLDPEGALGDTLTRCLDAAGLSVGAILLRDAGGALEVKAHVGSSAQLWCTHTELLERAIAAGSLIIPSPHAGPLGQKLLASAAIASALVVPIVARDTCFGVLVLASSRAEFGTPEEGAGLLRAARSVSTQLGQALALGRLFEQLSSAKQRYRALFDNARDAICITDLQGAIVEANRGWEDILGLAREAIVGRRMVDFIPARERSERPATPAVLEAGSERPVLLPVRHASGRMVQVEISTTRVELATETLLLSIGRDVGERERLAEQLRHAQKMEAIGRLAGGVAHDINNVLAAVLTYSEFLVEGIARGDALLDDAQEIRKAAQRGAAVTRQLLAFSSRHHAAQRHAVDVNAVIADLLKMLRTLIGEDVEVQTCFAPELACIQADDGQLEQVIMNLAVNARDAMPDGGTFSITTRMCGARVCIAVEDTGTGMDAATRERIFEPFFTTKELGKGTGLGLATVFGIVQQNGGEIQVDSEWGCGTTFQVFLPASKPASSQLVSEVGSTGRGHGGFESILVVEDDDALRQGLVRTLRDRGYRVEEACSGAAAMQARANSSEPLDLLVTDVVMPGMRGPQIAHELRRSQPGLRVLFMSGYLDDASSAPVKIANARFLPKPFTCDVFASRVRAVLDDRAD